MLGVGILTNFSILFENSSRSLEYIIFTYPKTIAGYWDLLKKLNLVKSIPFGTELILSLSVAIFLILYKNNKKSVPSSYSNFVELIFGKEIEKY